MSTPSPAETAPALLSIRDLSFFYGQNQILDDLQADVAPGEFLCIVGPSGAGKTTLLQCLAGLRMPTSGSVVFQGRPVTGPPEELAVVFQDYSRSLLPWMSTLGNVALPLKSAGVDKRTRTERAMQALEEVGLVGQERKYPWELSGGMQQRVAIARALAYRPKLIVMDEPFASVDAQTSRTSPFGSGSTSACPSSWSPTTSTRPSISPIASWCSRGVPPGSSR